MRLRDLLYEFEAVEDDIGGEGGVVEPVGEVVEPVGEGEPESWSPDRDQWEQTQRFIQQAAPFLDQLSQQLYQQQQGYSQQQPGYQEQPEDDFDPFDPESVQNYIARNIQQGVQQHLAPYEGLLGMVASDQGERLARTELEQIKSEVGEFDQDSAFLIASGLIEQGSDPGTALRQAAQFSQGFEKKIRADEREKYKQELAGLAGAPAETPASSAAAPVEEVPTGRGRYEEAIRRALANRAPVNPVG